MATQVFSWEKFNKLPIIGIMRNIAAEHAESIAEHYSNAGFTNLEITMNSKDAEKTISRLSRLPGLNIGAGTVCNMKDLEKALDAGASFIVTPIINEEVIVTCSNRNIPIFPGAYTPTEIYKAWSLGADMVKVFPASKLGAEYIKEVLAPLNQIKLLPTGGVHRDNFMDFIKAGAKGVGIGSQLFPGDIIQRQAWDEWKVFLSGFVEKFDRTVH